MICRHSLVTHFPGITELPEPVDEEKALANYGGEQKQRHMERQVKKWKRVEAGSIDAENVTRASGKVKEWQGKLREHLKENPQLRRDYSREKLLQDLRPAKDYNSLQGVVTKDNIQIREVTGHLIDRAFTRDIDLNGIQDALQNPLKIGKIRIDNEGKPSETYTGEKVTVTVNPETGGLVTTYKTSSKRAKKLKGESNDN